LKNLGALSEYAKRSQSSTKINKFLKSLSYNLDTMIWSKKPFHATVPLKIALRSASGLSKIQQILIINNVNHLCAYPGVLGVNVLDAVGGQDLDVVHGDGPGVAPRPHHHLLRSGRIQLETSLCN
jgi:hypothetical protein